MWRFDDETDLPAQINIVPMIDVIFSILAFFIIASTILTNNEGLPVNLPQASSSEAQKTPEVTVSIDAQGKIAVNRDTVELDQLENSIRALTKPSQPLLVILNADESVTHGQVVAVMDRLRRVAEAKLAIATKKPASN